MKDILQSGHTENPTESLTVRICRDTEEKMSRYNAIAYDKWFVNVRLAHWKRYATVSARPMWITLSRRLSLNLTPHVFVPVVGLLSGWRT